MFVKKVVPAMIVAGQLAGCQLGGQKETIGTAGGAVAGVQPPCPTPQTPAPGGNVK